MSKALLPPSTTKITATATVQPTPPQDSVKTAIEFIKSPNTLILLAGIVAWWFLRDGETKNKLASGRWGGSVERKAARISAIAKIKAPKKNSCALYINTPTFIRKQLANRKLTQIPPYKKSKQSNSPPTYYIPDTQQSTIVIGAAGSGKTYSAINPMVRSALDQGHSVILYDFKFPGQAKELAIYAVRRGYKVHILAPGYEESSTLNILDFIKDSQDAVGAEQLAEVIVKNCKTSKGSSDPFFEQAGMTLVQGLFLLTKWVYEHTSTRDDFPLIEADLLTAACLINLPNLASRIQHAANDKKKDLSRWTLQPSSQLISTHGGGTSNEANKTETSIISTASSVFNKFIKKDFIGAFCQDSNLELNVDEKVLVIMGLNQENRYSIGPILASAMHMLVSKNIVHSNPRKSPLIVALDELPTIYLPALPNWLAEARSAGFNGILGLQTMRQLQNLYGEDLGKIILSNCANKLLFNPGDFESAEIFSKYVGNEEVTITNKSKSSGKNGSTSTSKNLQTKEMIPPNEILKFPPGDAISILSGSRRGKEAFIPQKTTFTISDEDMHEVRCLEGIWDSWIENFRKSKIQLDPKVLDEMFKRRTILIENLFPEPPAPAKA